MNDSSIYHVVDYPPPKARKATQACNQCRKRRRRCEGGQPCLGCLENATDCVFDDQDRPPETFRRVLQHAQQHANKVEALSQKLDQLLHQLNATCKRDETTIEAFPYYDGGSQLHFPEASSMTTITCSVERWPAVCAILNRACIPEDAAWTTDANFETTSIANPCAFAATANSRKRKRETRCTGHLVCARGDLYSMPNKVDQISRSRAGGLIQSYVQHIHKLYPIVDLAQLDDVLNRQPQQFHPYTRTMQRPRTPKRLKSLNTSSPIESMPHALLYIVLALGEMCERRRSRQTSKEPMSLDTENIEYEPHSPVSTIVSSALLAAPTPCSGYRLAMPGLHFYERATRIMGPHLDGNELIHAQVAILAGLYKIMVGRPAGGFNWIHTAGRTIENLLRRWNIVGNPPAPQDNHKGRNNNGHFLHNERILKMRRLILLNAWTCVLLEDDVQLHAELPQSGLRRYEDLLPLPWDEPGIVIGGRSYKEVFSSERMPQDNIILIHHTAQLALQKEVSRIQQHYVGDQCLQLSSEQLCRTLRRDRKIIEEWRLNLPCVLRWTDDAPAPDDVLSTKLRMKYYDGLLDVYRPYLDYALHVRPYYTTMRDIHTLAVDMDGNRRSKAEIYVFQVLARMPDCEVRDAIGCCLEAAFRSVRTFLSTANGQVLLELDRIASEQYRNVLMLCAAYMAPSTRGMIRPNNLVDLISTTVVYFKEQALTTEWCSNAGIVLERIRANISTLDESLH